MDIYTLALVRNSLDVVLNIYCIISKACISVQFLPVLQYNGVFAVSVTFFFCS